MFPGCYAGRWPHIHFEVFPSLDAATDVANAIATSQIAIPQAICEEIYGATSGYEQSTPTLSPLSLETDGVFGEDAAALQLGTITGTPGDGLAIRLDVPVSATPAPASEGGGGAPPAGGPAGPGGPGGPPAGGAPG